ncbi:active breakpoint cluster region-related protein isoform X1 [Conger conger]|uniref:active breakpoint cluster region-related protein isoform X1 n=2 Tax=Conger conger TaxID=82655 RepID=UPI002A5AB1DC|nr:active breakpoint cluster region-related protein isoform X1 [Conger conger]XP_061092769.1 active breakpoint cluster region-related protein isoform X1 [Conger conger]XP_061092770.1 active breakpoint cluster region-related protein isoform X1 [Conger conger]XP_061092771.1 active breakpoint cluster region-related protein isoform X1 [Conger conger]
MDVYEEALDYLRTCGITVTAEMEPDLLDDVFEVETEVDFAPSPLHTDSIDFPDTPTDCGPEMMLERRLVVLTSILTSEELYLSELETLLTPMKALKATAGTSQPVLSTQQVRTVFFQVPELRDLHKEFYTTLRARLEPAQGQETQGGTQPPPVGDLFLRMVSQLGVYRGFIDNYESAVEIVRKCTQTDQRFRTLAESMMSCKGSDNSKTTYTFEALLYKPLDRVTKTTLVLHDLLKHTPLNHQDHAVLQEALRISSSFLSGVNEESQCKRAVTLSTGMRRQLIRDGFVVDICEGGQSMRHLFLYTDLLLCAKLKGGSAGKQAYYRFSWYLPLAGLRVHWAQEQELSADLQFRVSTMRDKMFQLRHELRQQGSCSKAQWSRTLERSRRKLQQVELWLLTHSPLLSLELHSPNGKSHTLGFSSMYELEGWREAIEKLKGENLETVPPDLLTLTSSCAKLRMTQHPHLQSLVPASADQALCGTLSVAVHSACGLEQPASLYICLEVDGYRFYDNRAQTHPSLSSPTPQWDEELSLEVDDAQCLRVLCVMQECEKSRQVDRIQGRSSIQLDPTTMLMKWRKYMVSMNQIEVHLSLKYSPHPLVPPSQVPVQQQPVFNIPIGVLAQQEGVLVPHIVRSCIKDVELRGLEEVGIYRISGAASDIQSLKSSFDTNLREAMSRLRSMDVNAVSGVLKLFFRELPEPLIPREQFQSLSDALAIPDLSSKMQSMCSILQACPDVNRNTFLFLLHHLRRVSEKQEINKMTLMNLATVFGPSLVRPPEVVLGQCGPQVDISQEVVVQVQVLYFYLQCSSLPAPITAVPLDTEEEEEITTGGSLH